MLAAIRAGKGCTVWRLMNSEVKTPCIAIPRCVVTLAVAVPYCQASVEYILIRPILIAVNTGAVSEALELGPSWIGVSSRSWVGRVAIELTPWGYVNSSQAIIFAVRRPFLPSRCAFSGYEGEFDPRSGTVKIDTASCQRFFGATRSFLPTR